MHHFPQNILRGLAYLAFAGGVYAAPFVAPAEENPPFRRDLLPIDSDSISALSGDLSVLVHGIPLETAAERRAAAQSLALALALDPTNSAARDTISALSDGKQLHTARPEHLTQSKARFWQIHAWLDTPEAGADGKLLGNMMGDAAAVLDPSNPLATELKESDEKGKWDNWVAPLSSFQEKVLVKNETDPFEDVDPDMPEPEVPEKGKPSVKLKKGSVNTVFYYFDEKNKIWNLHPASVEMVASTSGSDHFKVSVAGAGDSQDSLSSPILNAVKALHDGLPDSGLVTLSTDSGGNFSLSKNRENITGPGFVLANAVLTGVEPNATVIARLDDKGKLAAPEFFWRMINALADGKGGRLVIPAGTERYFTAMLALEKPDFFLKYEVLVASTPEQFVEFCAKQPSKKYAASFANFQEIKSKGQGTALGSYLANRFVRQRLQEIVDAAPFHLSAKLLAQQGAGERPRSLSKNILAAELWRMILPMEKLTKLDIKMVESESITNIEKLYDTLRDEVESLERYTDIRDRELVSEGKDVVITLRSFARTLRNRTDDVDKRFQEVSASHRAMVRAYNALVIKLAQLSSDPLPDGIRGRRPPQPNRNN